jgi:type IV pilus assembly protein PilP
MERVNNEMTGRRSVGPHCIAWTLLLIFLLVGCAEDSNNSQVPAAAKKTKPPVKKEQAEVISEPVEEEPQGFVYSSTGRRDPFEPLVQKGDRKQSTTIPLTPLQRFDLSQYRLQAVLIGKGAPRAMVGAPDGKTYILTPGIKIGKREGVVKEITRESVLIEEVHYDMVGAVTRKLATIDMPEQKSF